MLAKVETSQESPSQYFQVERLSKETRCLILVLVGVVWVIDAPVMWFQVEVLSWDLRNRTQKWGRKYSSAIQSYEELYKHHAPNYQQSLLHNIDMALNLLYLYISDQQHLKQRADQKFPVMLSIVSS
jgi:hypothetical protein